MDSSLDGVVGAVLGALIGVFATLRAAKWQLEAESRRATAELEAETRRADAESKRADREEKKADQERVDAKAERIRVETARELERQEQHVYEALQYFTGKTQNRNVGISVVEGYWTALPNLRAILRPLLINQAIYLLTASDQVKDWHERNNLQRIMRLVLDDKDDPQVRLLYPDLRRAVNCRLRVTPQNQKECADFDASKGVEVPEDVLSKWQAELGVV